MSFSVIRDFSSGKYTDSELYIKTNQIITKASKNTTITELPSLLANITAKNAAFLDSQNNLIKGEHSTTVIKDNCRADLEELLKELCTLAQLKSQGNESVIHDLGLETSKQSAPVGTLDKPTGLKSKPGENSGSIIVSYDVVDNALFYEIEYTLNPVTDTSVWTKKTSTKHFLLLEQLVSGAKYSFRVAAGGSDPSRIWSDIISSFIL
jgi:hypothetical protein